MHPLLLSSDFDPMQMAIIIIAVFAGFIKWLWESWQQKQAAPPPLPPDPEEQRLREAAWRKQTGQSSATRPPPLPPVVAPSPWDELRKAWAELQEAVKTPAAAPARPERRPQQRQTVRQQQPPPIRGQQSVRAALSAPAQRAAPAASTSVAAAIPALAVAAVAPVVPKVSAPAPAVGIMSSLQNLRRDPALMRQAILMQEILGPPKALQSSGDFAN